MKISQLNNVSSNPAPQTGAPVSRAESSSSANPAREETAIDPAVLREATSRINQTIQNMGKNLQFTVDAESGEKVVKVVDTTTKETIRQIPSEEVLAIAKAMDKLQGLLIHEKA